MTAGILFLVSAFKIDYFYDTECLLFVLSSVELNESQRRDEEDDENGKKG
jgi:hypothetical protein